MEDIDDDRHGPENKGRKTDSTTFEHEKGPRDESFVQGVEYSAEVLETLLLSWQSNTHSHASGDNFQVIIPHLPLRLDFSRLGSSHEFALQLARVAIVLETPRPHPALVLRQAKKVFR